MPMKQVVPGLWQIPLGFVNAFLAETSAGLALIDTGVPGSASQIMDAVRSLGKGDLRHLLVTHCHSDHSGSVAELKRLTGAPVTMHPIDAAMVREGKAIRPLHPSPGLFNAFVCRFLVGQAPTEVEPCEIDHEVQDGETLACGFQAVHVPGHCAGQLAFLWPDRGVLIAADAAANVFGLALSPLYEDLALGKQSLVKLASLEFEAACFGHGRPIQKGASRRFARNWPPVEEASPRRA